MREVKMKKVLLIQFSDFGLGRGLYIAKAFSKLGFNILVITNKPVYINKHTLSVSQRRDPTIRVIELSIPFAGPLYKSVMGRLLIYIFFMVTSFLKMIREGTSECILYSRGPQPFTEIICGLYKIFFKKVKIISDTTDLWPDALRYVKMNKIIKYLLISVGHLVNRIAYHQVDAVVTLNENMARVLKTRVEKDVYIIYGAIDLDVFRPIGKDEALEKISIRVLERLRDKFVVLYAGLLGPFQNPMILVDLAKRMLRDDVVFLVVGAGPLREYVKSEVKKLKLSNVLFIESQPYEKMSLLYNLADVFLFTLAPIKFLNNALPKKFIEYAACGKPILCITPECNASGLCSMWKAGYHIEPGNLDEIVNIIELMRKDRKLIEALGRNARQMAENLFSIDKAVDVLRNIVKNLQ